MSSLENRIILPDLYATKNTADFLSRVTGTPISVEELPVTRELGSFVVPLIAVTADIRTAKLNSTLPHEDVRVANLRLLGVDSLAQLNEVVAGTSKSVNISDAKVKIADRHSGSLERVVDTLHDSTGYDRQNVGNMYQRFIDGDNSVAPQSRKLESMSADRDVRLKEKQPQPALDDQRERLGAYLKAGFGTKSQIEASALSRFLLSGPHFAEATDTLMSALERMRTLIERAKQYVPDEKMSSTFRRALVLKPQKIALLEHVVAIGAVETTESARPDEAEQLSGLGVLLERWPMADEFVLRENLVQAVRHVVAAPTVDDVHAARIAGNTVNVRPPEQLVPTLTNGRKRHSQG